MLNNTPLPNESIDEQILQAERNYKTLLQNDAEFKVLKEIRMHIKKLQKVSDSSPINDVVLQAAHSNH